MKHYPWHLWFLSMLQAMMTEENWPYVFQNSSSSSDSLWQIDSTCFNFHFCPQLPCITLKMGWRAKHPLLWQSVWAHLGKKVSDTFGVWLPGMPSRLLGAPVERLPWETGISQSATTYEKSFPGSKWDQEGFAAPQKFSELTHKWHHTIPSARAKWAELLRSLLLVSILFLWYSIISISRSFEVGGFFPV